MSSLPRSSHRTVRWVHLLGPLLLLGLLAGCAKEKPKVRILWPPLPQEPKLEWIGIYSSKRDFEKAKQSRLSREVLGEVAAESLTKPGAVVSNDGKKVFVVENATQQVWLFDFESEEIRRVFTKAGFQYPNDLYFDGQKRLWVVDAGARYINVFTEDQQPLFGFTHEAFKKPAFIGINEDLGRVYVSDVKAHAIFAFDLEGNFLFKFGERGDEAGFFNAPQGVAVDAKGRVFVADQLNARVQAFDADGQHLHTIGRRGLEPGNFEAPRALAFDSENHLYVTDVRRGSMQLYDSDTGDLLLVFSTEKNLAYFGMHYPHSIWIDATDAIYVSDLLLKGVHKFQYLNEEYLAEHPLPEPGGGQTAK